MHNIPTTPLYLSLDQGGHASRAVVFNARGERMVAASRAVKTTVQGERVELDGNEVVDSLRLAASDAVAQLGERARYLASAGLATQRANIICWRPSSGEPLSPVLSWRDRRAAGVVAALDPQPLQRKTGLFPSAHYGASKLAWCLQHLPAVREARQEGDLMLGPMASFVASRLSGSAALADPVNASRTLLWDLRRRDWDPSLCELFGVDASLLPPCVDSDHGFGELLLGQRRVPLSIVTGDLAAAAFADGMPDERSAYLTLGTGAFIQRMVAAPAAHPRLLDGVLWSSSRAHHMSLEGTVNGAGCAIGWLAAQQGVAEEVILERLAGWMAEVSEPPLFLNAVSGIGSPFWCTDEISCFDHHATLPGQAVAVVESILFLLYLNLREMERVLPATRQIVVNGGLASLDALCQRLADLSGLSVARSEEREGTARGLAFLQCRAEGDWAQRHTLFRPHENSSLYVRYEKWLGFVQGKLSGRCLYSVM